MAQYNAPDLRNRVRDAVEAFEKAMKAIGNDAELACPDHFDGSMWFSELRAYVEDMAAKNGSFIGLIDDADDKLAEEEADEGLEPGGACSPRRRPLYPYPAAE